MDTEREAPVARPVRRRPRLSLRMKIALAGLAGVGVAWLLPRGGGTPEPTPSLAPSDRPGVTAVQLPMSSISPGVSFRVIDGVRVFLVRKGNEVVGFLGLSTTAESSPVWWCPRASLFESASSRFDVKGQALVGSAPRDLDAIHLQVAQLLTVFPHSVAPGKTRPATGPPPSLPAPCPASERVG